MLSVWLVARGVCVAALHRRMLTDAKEKQCILFAQGRVVVAGGGAGGRRNVSGDNDV
jgi:hypothetical protein